MARSTLIMKMNQGSLLKRLLILVLVNLNTIGAIAQTDSVDKPVYFEPLTDGSTQFYFDEHYFLVDRDCQFKSIERVGKYNVALKNFDGPFVDYNNEGKVILEGSYANGKKEGEFTSYFANGKLKWIIHFKNDHAIDTAVYNYPDGLPMLEIVYRDSMAFVQNFWDTRRRQRVTDGNGKFEFSVKAEGYTEYGYEFTDYRGNIKDGKPDGFWDINLVYPNKERDFAGYEKFEKGKLKVGYDEILGVPYFNVPRVQIGPSLFFLQAEKMMSKNCTIDENQDFSLFIISKLDKAFSLYDAADMLTKPIKIEVTAQVEKNGTLAELEVTKGFPNSDADKVILNTLKNIAYWIPSYGGDDYIDDTFHMTADVFAEGEKGQLKFYNLLIKREKGI